MFHRGCLSLTLVQNFCMRFCKENDSLVNWNEIKDWIYVSSVLIIILVSLLMFLHLFQQLLYSENYIKSKFPASFLLIKD